MEEIAGKEDHVNIALLSQTHDFMEGLPAVISSDGVALTVTDMIICRDENAYSIGSCEALACALLVTKARLTSSRRHVNEEVWSRSLNSLRVELNLHAIVYHTRVEGS
jgi:hypothetical protein